MDTIIGWIALLVASIYGLIFGIELGSWGIPLLIICPLCILTVITYFVRLIVDIKRQK